MLSKSTYSINDPDLVEIKGPKCGAIRKISLLIFGAMILLLIIFMFLTEQSPSDISKLISDLIYGDASSCPSTTWALCGSEGGTCTIPSTVKYTTVAYGANTAWTFQEFTNSAGSNLAVSCNNAAFGDVIYGTAKVCCYNPLQTSGPSTCTSSWTLCGAEGSSCTVSGTGTRLVRYGANNIWTYRYFQGTFTCSNDIFADPIVGTKKACYIYNLDDSTKTWISCGSESGGQCSLTVDTANTNIMRLVKYGTGTRYFYREVYSTTGSVPCNNDFFDDSYSGSGKFCYVSSISDSTVFSGVVGSWTLVGSCTSCTLTRTLEYGTSSTTTYSTTEEWSAELTATVETEASFLGSGVTVSLSATAGYSIATTMESAFTTTTTLSCSATCGDTTGSWKMYQWSIAVGEYSGLTLSTFNVYGCNYLCTTSSSAPSCPLNYCADTNCTTCLTYT